MQGWKKGRESTLKWRERMTNLIPSNQQCQYFRDDKGVGSDCYEEQNGKAKFREEFGVFFCNHHYAKLSEEPMEGKDD